MADKESQLRLRLTAQNEASGAFEGVSSAMNTLKTTADTVTSSVQSAIEAMNRSLTGSAMATMANDEESSLRTLSESAGTDTAAITKAFDEMQTAINGVAMQIEKSTGDITSAIQRMQADTTKSVNDTNETVSKGGLLLGLQQIAQASEHVGSKGEGLFKDAIQQSADFEQSMSNIKAALVATGTPMEEANATVDQMKQKALDLGSHYHRSATEIGGAFDTLVRQGVSAKDVLDGVGQAAIQVSLVTKQDLGGTANVISDIYNEFSDQFATNGKSMQQNMDDVANTTVGAMLKARISTDDYMNTMKNVGPVASSAHQSITDLSTAVALLGEHGIKGGPAGTALKNLLLGLEPRTAKAAELMKELGISTKDGAADSFYQLNGNLKPLPDILGILSDKFGDLNDHQKQAALSATFTKYGLAGLITVVNEGKDKFNALKTSLQGVSAERAAGIMMDNLAGDMMLLHANTETLAKSFGDTLHPEMRKITQAADHLVQRFEALDPSTKKLIMEVLGIGSAVAIAGGAILGIISTIGFLNMGLGGLGLSFTSLFKIIGSGFWAVINGVEAAFTGIATFVMMNPMLALFIGIGIAVGVLAFEIYKHWDAIKTFLTNVWNEIKAFATPIWDGIKTFFVGAWNAMSAAVTSVINFIKPFITAEFNAIKAVFTAEWTTIKAVFSAAWDVIKTLFATAFLVIYDIVTGRWGDIGKTFEAAGHKLHQIVSDMWDKIKSAWTTAWDTIETYVSTGWDTVKTTFSTAWTDVKTGVSDAWDRIKTFFSDAWGDIKTGASNAWDDLKTGVTTGMTNVKQAISDIWDDIKTFFAGLPDEAMQWGKNIIDGFVNGIKSMISAVSNAVSSVVSAAKNFLGMGGGGSGDAVAKAAAAAPRFAEGGKVTQPTLALVGEGGEPEYIIPESKLRGQGGYTFGLPSTMPFGGANNSRSVVVNVGAINVHGAGRDGQQIGNDIMATVRRQFGFAL